MLGECGHGLGWIGDLPFEGDESSSLKWCFRSDASPEPITSRFSSSSTRPTSPSTGFGNRLNRATAMVDGGPMEEVRRRGSVALARRLSGIFGVAVTAAAVPVVQIAGMVTPGYDPWTRTISRLAEPGRPAAAAVTLAIFGVAFAMLALACALGPGALAGRSMLGAAGSLLMFAAIVPLNPASMDATTAHRVATFLAMLLLTTVPFVFAGSLRRRAGWAGYGRLSFAFGVAAVGLLLVGVALLPGAFDIGAWERGFLALSVAWLVVISIRLTRNSTDPLDSPGFANSSSAASISADESVNAAAASASSSRL